MSTVPPIRREILVDADDASVAGGFLVVTVRPWQVMMEAD